MILLNMKRYFSPTVLLKVFLPFVMLFTALAATAQDKAATAADTAPKTVWTNPVAITMLVIIVILLIVIAVLASVVTGTAKWQNMQLKNSGAIKTVIGILFLLSPALASAQDAAAPAAETSSIAGLTSTTFYLLVSVIAIELLVVLLLGLFVMKFLSKQSIHTASVAAGTAGAAAATAPTLSWWERFNGFRPVEQESNIDLGHDYDGIRELDNKLPGWWLWGFYLTIFVGIIYFYRYEISHTGLSSKQQYELAVKEAEEAQKAYLEKAGNKVDENTVTLLTDAASISAGKANFEKTCATCHGVNAQGNIGPNLTDDYWIHSGGIKDVFKTIKYGWPDKGMQSWKDQYSPMQIQQLASYIKSLRGSNPAGAKEKQGELYKEDGAAPTTADTSATVTKDTTAVKK